MKFTDIFIQRPVLATVVSLLILLLGLRSATLLEVRQFPLIKNTVITITTTYPGASSELMKGFVTSPLQQAVAEASGIDFISATSSQGRSTIEAQRNLRSTRFAGRPSRSTAATAASSPRPRPCRTAPTPSAARSSSTRPSLGSSRTARSSPGSTSTSAMATARFLDAQRPGGTAFVIGESGLTTAIHSAGYVITDEKPSSSLAAAPKPKAEVKTQASPRSAAERPPKASPVPPVPAADVPTEIVGKAKQALEQAYGSA